MAAIDNYVKQIREAVYGKDVREAIAAGIEQCYADSTANAQIARINAAATTAKNSIPADYTNLSNDVAKGFSSSTNYTAGQYVLYNGLLYRFTADHPAGDWIGTDATTSSLGTEVSDLKSALSEIEEPTKNLVPLDIINTSGDGFIFYSPVERMPAGTYTLTINESVSGEVSACRIAFLKTASYHTSNVLNAQIFLPDTDVIRTFTIDEPCLSIYVFANTTVANSAGHTLTINKIQVEAGSTATPVIDIYNTAVDAVARASLENKIDTKKALRYGGLNVIPTDDSINNDDYHDNAYYIWTSANAPQDLPDSGVYSLFGFGEKSFTSLFHQLAFGSPDEIFFRRAISSGWRPWHVMVHCILPNGENSMTAYLRYAFTQSKSPVFLGPYDYYLETTLVMPDNTTLVGCGSKTRIIFTGESGSAIKMGSECTIRDVQILGSAEPLTPGDGYQNRNGIEWSISTNYVGNISNCHIANFEGAAILAKDTGTPVDRGLMISDCYLHNNHIGIYIQKNCEFCKISNCVISENHYGMVSRGGNNNVSTCGFDKNFCGMQIDMDEGSNTGHGTIANCSVNHSNNNEGYGLIVRGTGRMLITNCNFYYSDIRFENTNGNIFSHCGFGRNAVIEITGQGCTIIDGCMFLNTTENAVIRYNNTQAKIQGCYTRNGTEIGFTDSEEPI